MCTPPFNSWLLGRTKDGSPSVILIGSTVLARLRLTHRASRHKFVLTTACGDTIEIKETGVSLGRRSPQPAVSPADGHLTTPTVAWLPGLCENFRPTASKSQPDLTYPLSSHWATSPIALSRLEQWAVANVGDSLRRLSSLHIIYNSAGDTRLMTMFTMMLVVYSYYRNRCEFTRFV